MKAGFLMGAQRRRGCAAAMCAFVLAWGARAEDLQQYGRDWEQIKQELKDARGSHDARIKEIQRNNPPGSQRDALVEHENGQFRQKNQELGARRDKIHQKVIEEVNTRTKGGTTDASAPMEATKGTKPGEKGFRGTQGGDLDTGSGSRTAGKVQEVLDDMGIKVEGRARGGTIEFGDDFNLTVNKQGRMGQPGSAAHQTQVGVDARNPETFVSEGMAKDQVGRKAVEVQDNIKKARNAYDATPDQVVDSPDMQQRMAKSTKKIMDTQTLSDAQVEDILKQSGSTETVQQFKDRMERIKEGQAKPSDMTPENVESTQKAAKKIAETAAEQSTSQAHKDMADAQRKINDLEAQGDPASKQQARKMREDLVDSRERLEQTRKANSQPQDDLPTESVRKGKPGQTFDAEGKPTRSGQPADADGPGGSKAPADADGPGGAKAPADADGPGGSKAPADADGPGGSKAPADADGPGATGSKAGGESAKAKAGRLAGEYADGAVIIGQAGKIREGIKEGDSKKVLEGLAGKDIADHSDVQGGKDYVEDMDQLLGAKSAEAKSAAVGKLRRMGATAEEISEYEANYDSDPAKARSVVQEVKGRGGTDAAPRKGLEGAGPEEDSWQGKDQLEAGARQAGSYGKTILDGVSLGGVSRGDEAESDLTDAVKQSGQVDEATAQRVLGSLYTDLRERGATPEEARAALKDYFKSPRDVRELVAELKERDPEKAEGSGRKREGLTVDAVEVEEDPEGVGTRIKDTFVNAGKAVKETLIDKPVSVVNDTINDIMDASGIGSAKNDAERDAVETDELTRLGNQSLKDQLIRDGATPEQAARAIEGMEKDRPQDLRQLRNELRAQRAREEAKRLAQAKAEQERAAREKAEQERIAKEAREQAEINKPPSKPWSEMNDAERRNALKSNEDAAWKNFTDVIEHDPEAAVRILDSYSQQRSETQNDHTQSDLDLAQLGSQVADASTSGEQQARDARNLVNQAGQQAQDARSASASTTAQADAKDSWGNRMGDAVAKGVEDGARTAATALGSAVATEAGRSVFGKTKLQSGDTDGQDDGEEVGGKSAAGGGAVATTRKGSGSAKASGASSTGTKSGGQKSASSGGGGSASKDGSKTGSKSGASSGSDAYVYVIDCPKCGYREGPVRISGSSALPAATACPKCGATNRNGWHGLASNVPRSPVGSASTSSTPKTTTATPPANPPTVAAPAPAPAPAPVEKKGRCPRCKSPNIQFSNDHYVYGHVWKCNACGNAFRSVYIVYE
ncbi:MAG: hypothetical protein KBA51_06575 [Kiritimatiellae bacterium]|nr:hypothetical protein [Kiritimatiellia bacterium]